MPLGKILSRAGENSSHALLGKQGVCIYKRSKPAVPGDAGNRRFCLLGSIPSPLNSVSRWLRLCEPDGFLKNAVFLYGAVCDHAGKPASPFYKKSPPGMGEKAPERCVAAE